MSTIATTQYFHKTAHSSYSESPVMNKQCTNPPTENSYTLLWDHFETQWAANKHRKNAPYSSPPSAPDGVHRAVHGPYSEESCVLSFL